MPLPRRRSFAIHRLEPTRRFVCPSRGGLDVPLADLAGEVAHGRVNDDGYGLVHSRPRALEEGLRYVFCGGVAATPRRI